MTFHIGLHEMCVRTGVRYVITKFSGEDSLPNFLTHGAPLRARFARARSSAINNQSVKFDKKLTVGSTSDALACEQALHLEKWREVTREPRARGGACVRGGERLLAGNRRMT